jgi:hypothetical protein
LGSKKKHVPGKRQETHFSSNEVKENWIEDYFERETAGARKRVEDAEAAVLEEQDDMMLAEIVGLTSTKSEKSFEEMLVAIRESLCDLAGSHDGEDGEDADNAETEQGKLSEDDEPGWVMGTITETVQQRIERFWQNQMKHDKLTNRDGRMQPATSVNKIGNTVHPN